MLLLSFILPAILSAHVAHGYLAVVTNYESFKKAVPTSFDYDKESSLQEAWRSSNAASYVAYQTELAKWAATATYALPDALTNPLSDQLMTTVPEWYPALPTKVKQFNEAAVNAAVSAAKAASGAAAPAKGMDMGTILVAVAVLLFNVGVLLL